MTLKRGMAAASCFAALAASAGAHASPVDMFGAGFEGKAMASAGAAIDTSGAAAYYNPANLAEATAARLDASLGLLQSSLSYNGGNGGSEGFAGVELGMVLPLPGLLKGAAFGLYAFFPTDDLGRVVARDGNSPQFLQAGAIHRFAVFSGLAYKLGPVAAGVGVQLLNSASGSLSMTTDEAAATVGTRTLTLDLVPTVALVAGISVDPLPFLRIGASYRGAGDVEVQLPSSVSLGPLGISLALDALSYWRPPTWTAGVAYHGKYLSADADVSYLQWSQAPELALTASVVTTSNLLPPLQSVPSGLKLQDTPAFRVGVDVPLPYGFAVLAGYAYDPTPVPGQAGPTNILDNDRHRLGLGASYSFPDLLGLSSGPMTLGVAMQYQGLVSRTVQKTDPLDPYGDAAWGGSLLTIGGTLTLRFGATR